MDVQASRQIAVLLRIGAIGFLMGAVAWALFWPGIAGFYPLRRFESRWSTLSLSLFPLSALSLILIGLSSFALGKLYKKWLAIVTGVVYIIAAAPFFLMNILLVGPTYRWQLEFIMLPGYGLLILGLFLWALTIWNIAKLTHHSHLAVAISATSIIADCIFLFLLGHALTWGPLLPTILTQPYVLAQILSAILLVKISSNTRQKP